jgi:hypothetical protein
MKSKKVLAILLSLAIMLTFMPTMAFAAGEDVVASDAVAAASTGVDVTTVDTGDEPNNYESLSAALNVFNKSSYYFDSVVISLNQDDILNPLGLEFETPLTILTNGYELGLPDVFEDGTEYCATGLCKSLAYDEEGALESITVNVHELDPDDLDSAMFEWVKDEDGDWTVSSYTFTCDACNVLDTIDVAAAMEQYATEQSTTSTQSAAHTSTVRYRITENATTGVWTFQSRSGYWRWNYSIFGSSWRWTDSESWQTLDTHPADEPTPEERYQYNDDVHMVYVADRIQHISGLPVIKATMWDDEKKEDFDADVEVTAATDAEIEAAKKAKKLDKDAENAEATCEKEAVVIYKAVVSDPDGEVVDEAYFVDDQAAPKTDHVVGKLEGIQLLEKSKAYNSAEAAIAAAGDDFVSLESDEDGNYYFRSYGDLIKNLTDVDVEYALSADKKSFTFRYAYRCLYDYPEPGTQPVTHGYIYGAGIKVEAGKNASTAAEAQDGKHSTCTQWVYPSQKLTYEYYKTESDTVKSVIEATVSFKAEDKDEADFSHVKTGSKYDVQVQPTCEHTGSVKIDCAICGHEVTVPMDKYADTFAAIPGTETKVTIEGREATVSADRMTATVAATCETAGGVYAYCTGVNNNDHPHYVLKEEIAKKGHKLDSREKVAGYWNTANPEEDVTYSFAQVECDVCGETVYAFYHSADGEDVSEDEYIVKYNAFDVSGSLIGKDCQTQGVVTYTVKGLLTNNGKAITEDIDGEYGPHSLEVESFTWNRTFKDAIANLECTVEGCTHEEKAKAEIEKSVAENGETTFTATYAGVSDEKKMFTLRDAVVTVDEEALTDANLIGNDDDHEGYAMQNPDVTVTIDGTEIDSTMFKYNWSVDQRSDTFADVSVTVKWDPEAMPEGASYSTTDSAESDTFKVPIKKTFDDPTPVVKYDGKDVTNQRRLYEKTYDAAKSFTVAAETDVEGASVMYAVANEPAENQEEKEALDYSLDAVELQDADEYFVYAQLSADGYTTYTNGPIASIVIEKREVELTADDATCKEGETPQLSVLARDADSGKALDIDPSEYEISTAGGQSLENLKAGKYAMYYSFENSVNYSGEGLLAELTVLTQDGLDPEEAAKEEAKEAKAAANSALADAAKVSADKSGAAFAADVEKAAKNVENAMKSGNIDDIKYATDALKTAVAAANKAASDVAAAKAAADKVTATDYTKATYDAVASAKAALDKALASGTKDEVSASAKKLNDAVAAAKKKAETTITVSPAKKTFKSKTKKLKKAKKFQLTATVSSGATPTFTKVGGSSKLSVSSTGKVTVKKKTKRGTYKVKVQVTVPANDNFKAATYTQTIKVVIKKK